MKVKNGGTKRGFLKELKSSDRWMVIELMAAFSTIGSEDYYQRYGYPKEIDVELTCHAIRAQKRRLVVLESVVQPFVSLVRDELDEIGLLVKDGSGGVTTGA